ncbi:hypothetical protein SUGI_0577350 [Cryptomeria japonica]|nr:hypothetical protein SUGI_0577350 [Cryptomeria japonica]
MVHGNENHLENNLSGRFSVLSDQGRIEEALKLLQTMDCQGIAVDFDAYAYLLHGCVNKKAIVEGKLVHAHIIQTGFKALETKILNMYAKCGLVTACLKQWTIMIIYRFLLVGCLGLSSFPSGVFFPLEGNTKRWRMLAQYGGLRI